MSKTTAVVADPVVSVFVLSQVLAEKVAGAADMAMDSQFDYRKACDSVADVFSTLGKDGLLNFESWEVVRKRFEATATLRAESNGAANPAGAANDCWLGVVKFIKEYHGLTKPKAEGSDAKRMAEKREAEKSKALEVAKGKSAAELESARRELYAQATDEAIAQAKALEKVIKVVQSVEKDAVSSQIKPLKAAIADLHKKNLEFVEKHGVKMYSDYVVFLKDFIAGYEDAATNLKV